MVNITGVTILQYDYLTFRGFFFSWLGLSWYATALKTEFLEYNV